MKTTIILAFVFLFMMSSALPAAHDKSFYRGIENDLNDFITLLPMDQMIVFGLDYLANDKEFQDTMSFVRSKDFKRFVAEFEGIKEYQEFLMFLDNAELNVYKYIGILHKALNLPPFVQSTKSVKLMKRSIKSGTGLRGLITDIEAILPANKIKALYEEKSKTSPKYKNLTDILNSDEFKKVVYALRANPQYQQLIQEAKEHGIDIEMIVKLAYKVFGWGI